MIFVGVHSQFYRERDIDAGLAAIFPVEDGGASRPRALARSETDTVGPAGTVPANGVPAREANPSQIRP
jgi:hypothetical protein